MAADLVEAGAGGGAVLEAHGFQDGVFAVFFTDGKQRLLHAALAGGLLRRLRGLHFRVIGKEAQLAEFFRRLRVLLRQDVLRDVRAKPRLRLLCRPSARAPVAA